MVKPGFDLSVPDDDIRQIPDIARLYEVSNKYLSIIIYSNSENKILSVRHFSLDTNNEYTPTQEIRNIINIEEQRFDNQSVPDFILNFTESSLVPFGYFNNDNQESLTRLIFGDTEKGVILRDQIPGAEIDHIFRIPAEMYSMLRELFPDSRVSHLYSKMIPLYSKTTGDGDNLIKLEFYADRYILLIFKEKEVHIVNTYFYQTPEDVVYYLLALCNQLDVSPTAILVSVSGLIDEQSPLFSELNKYFAKVKFDSIPDDLKNPALPDNYPDHYFSNLMKLAICG